MLAFGDRGYWDQRYTNETVGDTLLPVFDFYAPFKSFYSTIRPEIRERKEQNILVIGVGRSDIIDVLYEDGFRNIVAVDVSPMIIARMQQKYQSFSGVEFICLDVRKMCFFVDKMFALVIDKACIDALFCEIDCIQSVGAALREIERVMHDDGMFLSISHGSPSSRLPYLRETKWSIQLLVLPNGCGEGLSLFSMTRTESDSVTKKKMSLAGIAEESASNVPVTSLRRRDGKSMVLTVSRTAGTLTTNLEPHSLAELVRRKLEKSGPDIS